MIYDCFTFHSELDMLELRLRELSPVVDKFVCVEGTRTFTGQPKELVFAANRDRFAEWLPRITHVIVDGWPDTDNPWVREAHQRNHILEGLNAAGAKPDDWVLVSDVDEIPSVKFVGVLDSFHGYPVPIAFQQHRLFYNVHCRQANWWFGTRAVRAAWLNNLTPQSLRCTESIRQKEGFLRSAGWHLSYFLTPAEIAAKIAAYSHTEVNQPQYTDVDHIERQMRAGQSLVPTDGQRFAWVDLGDDLPRELREHPERYPAAWFYRPVEVEV